MKPNKAKENASLMDIFTKTFTEEVKALQLTPENVLKTDDLVFETQESTKKLNNFLKLYPEINIRGAYRETNTKVLFLNFRAHKSFDEQWQTAEKFIPHLQLIPRIVTSPLKLNGYHVKVQGSELELIRPEHRQDVWLIDSTQLVTVPLKKFKDFKEGARFLYQGD